MMLRQLLVVATAVLVGPGSAAAQTIRGVLLHENTGAPVGGAYIVLLGRDSLERTRALTNGLGRFTIHAPRPGSYRLKTELIGYRSVITAPFELDDGDVVERELRIVPVVFRLAPLTVEGNARECRLIGEQALEVLVIWEEARKVLTAVAWSDLQGEFVHELERFERWYSHSFRLLQEKRSTTPTLHVMPFRSRSVEELEEFGYVVLGEDSVVYEAPDAQVFFSDPFLQHHCFRLDQRNDGGRQMVGLRFEPVGDRTVPDVKGVLWLDGETGALQRLELTYVNLGMWQRERGSAARVYFDRLPEGHWFVSSWWIRMPMVRRVEGLKGPVWDPKEGVVGFKDEGGEVLRVFAPDGRVLYAARRASVTGVVLDSTTGAGLAGAFVRLQGTERVTISDVNGRYWLRDLPEGRYTVTFTHPRATLFGVTDEEDVNLKKSVESQINLAVSAPRTIVARRCSSEGDETQGLLVGRVRDADRDTVVSANVRVTWLEAGGQANALRTLRTLSDSLGIYRVCVPKGASLSVEVSEGGRPLMAVPLIFGRETVQVLDLEFPRRGQGTGRDDEGQ